MEYSFYDIKKITPQKIADALGKFYDYYVPVIICVGTDAAIGDTLGPLVGTKLKELDLSTYVYGHLGKTVTAGEIAGIKNFIKKVHPLSKTLVVDAAVGREEDVGKIKVSSNGIYPGLGANKNLPFLGDGSIIGIVSKHSKNNEAFMNLTRFSPIYEMAETIANGIYEYVSICKQKPCYKSINGTFSEIPSGIL